MVWRQKLSHLDLRQPASIVRFDERLKKMLSERYGKRFLDPTRHPPVLFFYASL